MNAAFFSQGMDDGLVGGFVAAFVITFVNVLAGFLVGTYAARNKNHVLPWRKALGWVGVVAYIVGLFWFSHAVGQFRSLIQIEQDAIVAAQRVMEIIPTWDVFAIKEFYGWVLVFSSGLIGVVTTLKFYFSDDVYPGYGLRDRKLKNQQREWREACVNFGNAQADYIQTCQNDLFNLKREAESFVIKYEASLHKSTNLIAAYDDLRGQAQNLYAGCVQVYRRVNRSVSSNPRPAYFSDGARLTENQLSNLDTYDFEKDKDARLSIDEQIANLPSEYESALKKIEEFRVEQSDRYESYFSEIRAKGQQRFEQRANVVL